MRTTTSAAATPHPSSAPEALDVTTAAALSGDEVLRRLDSTASGLSSVEAARRLQQVGRNAVRTHKVTAGQVLWNQLRNPLLMLLLAAAAVSGFTGDPTDAVIIAMIVTLSVGLGFANEFRASKAVQALHARVTHRAQVWRDGAEQDIDVGGLVPGDVVGLHIGEIVPADMRLLAADELECDESMLSGESMPVAKSTPPVKPGRDVALSSCVSMGTIVHGGSGRGIVVCTGASTEFGRIAQGLQTKPPQTAFERGLARFSGMLAAVAGVIAVAVFVINVVLGRGVVEALLFSLSIAVGMTPAMMPAIVTVSMSAGSRSLARQRVLVKHLDAIEDLGNISILFTDKTGTLTEGKIKFRAALAPDGRDAVEPLRLGLLCNEATMTPTGPVGGNELDQALLLGSRDPDHSGLVADVRGYRRLGVLPFDHERQMVSVAVRGVDGGAFLITKGAPEAVLARCDRLVPSARETVDSLFRKGQRVVAIATRRLSSPTPPTASDEHDLTLVGFLTFFDTPKPDAGAAVQQLRELGVDVKIVTGDNGTVAAKLCEDIGLEVRGVLTGVEIDALDDVELSRRVRDVTVFARVNPEQKSRIIKTTRGDATDVAFMGDGVNDAVALHDADVGISVDSGTDVAKDAADVVMLDKDLGVLAAGIVEGRRVFANTMKYIMMASSSNFGNMFSAAGVSLIVSYLPMLPSQILLNNLLYDTGQLAIPSDHVDDEALARPARFSVGFIRRFMYVFGPVSSIFDFLTFWVMLSWLHAGMREFRTGWFVESILTQTLIVYVIRTRRVPFVRSRPSLAMIVMPLGAAAVGVVLPFTGLSHVLGFTPLPPRFLLVLVLMVSAYMLLADVTKRLFYRAEEAREGRAAPARAHPSRGTRDLRRRVRRFTAYHGART